MTGCVCLPHRTAFCRLRRATRAASPAALRRAVLVREGLSLELPRKEGIYRLEARSVEASGGSGGGGSAGAKAAVKGTLLGSCQLWVAAARDGTTLFWSHERCVRGRACALHGARTACMHYATAALAATSSRERPRLTTLPRTRTTDTRSSGAPLATRWAPSDAPWRVTLPLEPAVPGAKGLSVTLGVSVEPWVYKQPLAGLRGHRSEGPRVVVLQAVEGEGAGRRSGGGCMGRVAAAWTRPRHGQRHAAPARACAWLPATHAACACVHGCAIIMRAPRTPLAPCCARRTLVLPAAAAPLAGATRNQLPPQRAAWRCRRALPPPALSFSSATIR